jgi:dTDP-4-amino-4,6-dideoxygalactose transaminase
MIYFNKPYISGKELEYINEAVNSGNLSGDGRFTQKCHQYFEKTMGFSKCLLTTSCTDALEMCALLLDIQPGDEVIIPSYTFVSTANAFALRGARIIFADSNLHNPNINVDALEQLITPRTKAIVVVHYAGIACDMDVVMSIAGKYNVFVVEDAAQAIDSFYKGKPLGSIGHLGAFSFHETKNIQCGEGGALIINDKQFEDRAEIIREKGTNRSAFFRGEIDKYGWVDLGSSYLPSELNAAFLFAQLEEIIRIQKKRKDLWVNYYNSLLVLSNNNLIKLPDLPSFATNNGHMFYIICRTLEERQALIRFLKERGIMSVFHYISLHRSEYFQKFHKGNKLLNSDFYTDHLLRLPLFYELKELDQSNIIKAIFEFFGTRTT